MSDLYMKVGLVGCGNIGADLCIALQRGTIPAKIAALTDIDPERANILLRTFQLQAEVCSVDENAERVDFLIECASQSAVKPVLEAALRYGRDCLIMSVGGLMSQLELLEQARAQHIQVRIPSGALCGLDGIRAAMEAGLHTVVLTTRKSPKSLAGAPFFEEKNIDPGSIKEETLLFDGNALEAVKYFPANVNVAAALSLLGIGPERTRVRIIADPAARENIHEVYAEGAFGRLQALTKNLPSPRNAKSSYLASLSAVSELRAVAENFIRYHERTQAAAPLPE